MNKNVLTAIICFALFASCKNNKEKNQIAEEETGNAQTIAQTFPEPKVAIKTIGILLYDGYTTLDAMGPYQVLSELQGSKIFFVGKHKGSIENDRGMKVIVDTSINEVKQLDMLIIPGGLRETYQETKDMALLNWIKMIDTNSKYTCSVCTGAWILGATGLLKGKEATTHWYGKKILADDFGAKVQDKRYVHDGKYWTSAGVTAGMDMGLALVNDIAGEKYTKAAMLSLEYDPQPPFKGGSEQNTGKDLVESIRKGYDGVMDLALHPEKAFKNIQFDNAKDFVCGMPVSAGVGDTAHYKGKVYGFCSKECRDEFLKNPAACSAVK